MKKVKRWRYYCDFCRKSGGSAYHIRNHENACTNNPDRVCKMCALLDLDQVPMSRLAGIVEAYQERIEKGYVFDPKGWDDAEKAQDELLSALKKETDGCPACILSALRQTDMHHIDFDFKKEKTSFFARVNAHREENMVYGVDY